MEISEKLYKLRTENDMTQAQFGKIAGVSDKAVSTWEHGIKEPRIRPLQRICAYFDVDINLFIDTTTSVYKKEKNAADGSEEVSEKDVIIKSLLERLSTDQLKSVEALVNSMLEKK